jgi:branched-chain amino acid transport system ATP-binding protein
MQFSERYSCYDGQTLSAKDLSVSFGALVAINSVSLSIERSQIFGLIGPNGAGKTTVINCLTGFLKPNSGAIQLGERNITNWSPNELRRAGIARTFQSSRLFGGMSVLENVEAAALALGGTRRVARRHAAEILSWIGLRHRTEVIAGTLAYTEAARVGIARALVGRPAFVLLDEPAAGMSDHECDDMIKVIQQLPKLFGCGVLLIEHNMHVVMKICSHIHVLDGGKTLAEGSPAAIQTNEDVISAYLGDE